MSPCIYEIEMEALLPPKNLSPNGRRLTGCFWENYSELEKPVIHVTTNSNVNDIYMIYGLRIFAVSFLDADVVC